MDPITQQTVIAAAGAGGEDPLYVDDVFSTYLYDGTGTSGQTITNGIDLAGEGGLYWMKNRSTTGDNMLFDTERTSNKVLVSNTTAGEATDNTMTPTSTGFTISGGSTNTNNSSFSYASWTFRKAPGFFDVVTYTGNGVNGRQISHALGSTPGMVIVKRTNGSDNWTVQHRSLGGTKSLYLNLTNGQDTSSTEWNNTAATSTVFTVGTSGKTNANGDTYVAYLFAHDEPVFGTDEDESIIKCGSYLGVGGGNSTTVDVGFEPQFLITKKANGNGEWRINDIIRGIPAGGGDPQLNANSTAAEIAGNTTCDLTSTGFISNGSQNDSATYIYMAIRRPHKPPTVGTDVFSVISRSGSGSTTTVNSNMGPVDMWLTKSTGDTTANVLGTRMLGPNTLTTSSTAAENTNVFGTSNPWDVQEGVNLTSDGDTNASFRTYINYFFKRTPGFMDVVAYTGTGSARTVNHNLGSAPAFMIVKNLDTISNWRCYHKDLTDASYVIQLDEVYAEAVGTSFWNSTDPTSTEFTVGTNSNVNKSGDGIVAYLFATLPGISKVGSYTGTGNAINVDCGFTTGARFVLIKKSSGSGNWYVFDTVRGITSGNDPYIYLNDTIANQTTDDYIDPLNAGFALPASTPVNTSGSTYIFLAIA